MKKLLSTVLSLAILMASTVFASPVAVMPESSEEQVTFHEPEQEKEAQAFEEAELLADVPGTKALKFGVKAKSFNDGLLRVTNENYSTSVTGDVIDLKWTTANEALYQFYWVAGDKGYVLEEGKVYALVYDFADGDVYTSINPGLGGQMFGQRVTSGIFQAVDDDSKQWRFAQGKPYKFFKLAQGKSYTINELTIAAKDANVTSETPLEVTINHVGLYYKPDTLLSMPEVNYDIDNTSIVTVTYPTGLHSEVIEALYVEGAVYGVQDVVVNGNNVTYTLDPDADVTLPSLVNEDATGTYPEQTLQAFANDVNTKSLKFGVKVKSFNDHLEAPSDSKFTSSKSNGVITMKWTTADETLYKIYGSSEACNLEEGKVYALVYDFAQGDDYTLLEPALGGGMLAQKITTGVFEEVDSDSKSWRFAQGKPYKFFKLASGKSFNMNDLRIAAAKDSSITADNPIEVTLNHIGLYYKPDTLLSAPALDYDADNTSIVTVTYSEGLHPEVVEALRLKGAVDGVRNARVVGDTVTYILDPDATVVVPSLVNADGTKIYPEQTLQDFANNTNTKALKFGILDKSFNTNLSGANAANYKATVTDGVINVIWTSASDDQYVFYQNSANPVVLEHGKVYALVFDFNEGDRYTPIYPFLDGGTLGQRVSGGILDEVDDDSRNWNFAQGKPYKFFKLAQNQSYSIKELRIAAGDSTVTSDNPLEVTINHVGLYYKPDTMLDIPTAEYDSDNTSVVTVTYSDGLHADVVEALRLKGAVNGVINARIYGNTVTYILDPDANVVIPSLVNADGTKTYPEQTLQAFADENNTKALKYGVLAKRFDKNLVGATVANKYTATVTGGVINVKWTSATEEQYTFYSIDASSTEAYSLETGKVYALCFDFADGNVYNKIYPLLGGGPIGNHIGSGTLVGVDSDSKTWQFAQGKPYKLFKLAEGKTYTISQMRLAAGDSNVTAENPLEVSISGVGLYYKPDTLLATPTSVYDFASNTVTVTYESGLHPEVVSALTLKGAIDGVKNARVTGNTVTYIIDPTVNVTIPSLVNQNGTGTYPQTDLQLVSASENIDTKILKFGLKIDRNETFNKTSGDGYTATLNTVDGGVDLQFTKTWGGQYGVYSKSHALEEGKVYALVFDFADGNDYPALFPTVGGASFDNHIKTKGNFEAVDEDSVKQEFTAGRHYKFFKLAEGKSYTFSNVTIGARARASADSPLNIYLKGVGLYYKPEETDTTSSDVVYDYEAQTAKLTYPNGLHNDVKSALLTPGAIDGVNGVSIYGNTVIYTVTPDIDIEIPSLINASGEAVYPAMTLKNARPITVDVTETGIRTNVAKYGMGVRTVARVHQYTRAVYGDENLEYGTLVTLERILTLAGFSENDLTFETQASGVNIMNKESFGNGVNKLHDIDGEYDYYSAAFVGIPATVDNYKLNLVFRPYVKYTVGGVTNVVYGEVIKASPYSIAKDILGNTSVTDEVKDYCKQIVDACDGKEGAVLPGAEA